MEVTSTLQQQIQQDLKAAMIAKQTDVRDVLRMVTSEIKNRQIDNKQEPLTNEQVLEVILKLEKQRKDSITQYTDGGRLDLAEAEQKELDILARYLPTKLTETELKGIVSEEVEKAESKDFGTVMKAVMVRVKGQADGNAVRPLVQELLA